MSTPHTLIFHRDGTTYVADAFDTPLTEFMGRHEDTLKAFKKAAIDWTELPDIEGKPIPEPAPEDDIDI
jgi:hypothetical protein